MITVLIVEESLLIGGRLRSLLLETAGNQVVYHSVEYKNAALLLSEIKPQVVLLDMCLPGTTSIELLQQIKDSGTDTTVVAMVNCEDYQRQLKCTTIGADYILDKYHEFEKIPGIINILVSKINPASTYEKPKSYSKF
jgi:DNA-binding NarL/FixJ family response regulator